MTTQRTMYQAAKVWDKRKSYQGYNNVYLPSDYYFRQFTFIYHTQDERYFSEGGKAKPVVMYGHSSHVNINYGLETVTFTGYGDWEGKDVTWRYGTDTSVLTITVPNINIARMFENNRAAFVGLYIVVYDTKRVYRLTQRYKYVDLERILNPTATGLHWLQNDSMFGSELAYET